jgi:hypothetical protein
MSDVETIMANSFPSSEPAPLDVADQLRYFIGETGGLSDFGAGYRIKIYHTRMFPWDDVFKTLLYRDFKVYVMRHKADLYIEAQR